MAKRNLAKKQSTSSSGGWAANSHFSNLTSQICIFLFAFLLYSNTLHHGFVMDDGAVITNHETVQKGFAGIKELFGQSSVYGSTKENFGTYRPLTMSLFAIEKQFFGNNSSAFHLVQVLLYSVLCVVIFILLKKLLKDYHPLLPLISTLIFVAHPIHTEVVANIKSADEILSLLFCSLALLFAIQFSETSSKKFLGISFLFFTCGLFSKESAATFIFIIPLALYFFTSSSRRNILTITGVHAFAILLYFLARNSALDKAPEGIAIINNSLAGAQYFSERYATTFVILLHYLKLLFYPHTLCWDYGYNQIPLVNFLNPLAIISVLLYFSIVIFSLIVILKSTYFKLSNLPTFKLISFCILFFLISLSVSSNIFVLIGATMAERFLFTPSLAFCILLAFGLIRLLKINFSNLRHPSSFARLFSLIIILALYSYKTYSRNKDWKSNLTLFAKGVEDCPNSYRTNTTFAWESVLAGEKETDPAKKKIYLQNAVTYYKKGLAIYDKVAADWYNYAVSNSNLGHADEAVKGYGHALQADPKHLNSLYNLASLYLGRKDYPNSLKYFIRAYEVNPGFMDVAFKVGLIYHMTGNPQQAIPYYEHYLKNNPNNKDVITNLSIAYNSIGEKEKAMQFTIRLQQLKQ